MDETKLIGFKVLESKYITLPKGCTFNIVDGKFTDTNGDTYPIGLLKLNNRIELLRYFGKAIKVEPIEE